MYFPNFIVEVATERKEGMDVKKLRQTDLTPQELIDELDEPRTSYPRCFIINEIGAACLGGEDKDGKGIETLLFLLNNEDVAERRIAFSWICTMPDVVKKNSSRIEEFRANPDNQTFLEGVDEQVKTLRQRLN